VKRASIRKFDFFISYRWKMYAEEARTLKMLLEEHDCTCWLDVNNPFVEDSFSSETRDAQLALHLRTAMNECDQVLFFETASDLLRQIGGPTLRDTSWQEKELSMADQDRLITIYDSASPSWLGFGKEQVAVVYSGLREAAEKIKARVLLT
jgi:hypothetical protein